MRTSISFKQTERSEAIESLIEQKLKHFEKYDHQKNSHIEWVCNANEKLHTSEVNLHMENTIFHTKVESNDLYKTIDIAISKLDSQIRKHSDKAKDHLSDVKNRV